MNTAVGWSNLTCYLAKSGYPFSIHCGGHLLLSYHLVDWHTPGFCTSPLNGTISVWFKLRHSLSLSDKETFDFQRINPLAIDFCFSLGERRHWDRSRLLMSQTSSSNRSWSQDKGKQLYGLIYQRIYSTKAFNKHL